MGQRGGVTIFFSELNDNCSVTFNVLLSGCQGQSKKKKQNKKNKAKNREVAVTSVHTTLTLCLRVSKVYKYI